MGETTDFCLSVYITSLDAVHQYSYCGPGIDVSQWPLNISYFGIVLTLPWASHNTRVVLGRAVAPSRHKTSDLKINRPDLSLGE
jgi:hypothetical protein